MEKRNKEKLARMIPHNIEAEQSVLGCILIDDNVGFQIMNSVKVEDFYTEAHKNIYESMLSIYAVSKPVDYVTLTDDLERKGLLEAVGGIDYITTLTNIVPSAANYKHYTEIMKRDSVLRKLIRASQEIIDRSYNSEEENILGFAEKSIFDIAEQEDFSSLVSIEETLPGVLNKFEEIEKIILDEKNK